MERRIFGYVVHKVPHHILPSTPMFSNDKGTVTAEMIKDALDYVINIIAMKDLSPSRKTGQQKAPKNGMARSHA